MKFTCTRENLAHTLGLVSGIANKQSNLPILANVLISVSDTKVEFIGTNLEVAVRATLRAKIDQTGVFTVPAKTLVDYVHLLSADQVDIRVEGNELIVAGGTASTKIKGMPAEEFPVIPEIEDKHAYSIQAETLKTSLSQVLVAVARNEIRPELSGIYFGFFSERFDGLVLAATDSYRLAEKKLPVDQGTDALTCIVPAKTASEIVRLVALARAQGNTEKDVRLSLSDNQITVRFDQFEMTSRLVSGRYPDYAQIIPEEFATTAVVSKAELAKRVKAASLFTTVGTNAVLFKTKAIDGAVAVSSTSTQTGEHESEVDADVTGNDNAILLNHRYVLDGIAQMPTEKLVFCVNNGESPALLQPEGATNYVYIVMPIRQ